MAVTTLVQQAYPSAALCLQRAPELRRWSGCAQCDSRSGWKSETKSVGRRSTALGLGFGLLLTAGGGWVLAAPVQSPGQSRSTGLVFDDEPHIEPDAWISKCLDVRSGRKVCTPEGLLCLGIKAAGHGEVGRDGLRLVFQCTGNDTSDGQGEGTSATPKGEAASPQETAHKPPEEGTTGEVKEPMSEAEIGNAIRALREEKVAAGLQDPSGTSDFWKGVVEETQRIEWPTFSKVLGTTGVVVAMILGSSVVLLTVNALLSQLSDSIFKNI